MKIYFCVSMTGSQEKMGDYKEIIDYLGSYGDVLNKFVGEKIVNSDAKYIYNRDVDNLKHADILIADVTVISTGVGFELGYADNLNIKTLVIYDETKKLPSSIILGNPNFTIRSYKNMAETKKVITDFIKKVK